MPCSPFLNHLAPIMPSSPDCEDLPRKFVTVDDPALYVDPRKVLRKMDLRLVPPACMLYLLSIM